LTTLQQLDDSLANGSYALGQVRENARRLLGWLPLPSADHLTGSRTGFRPSRRCNHRVPLQHHGVD